MLLFSAALRGTAQGDHMDMLFAVTLTGHVKSDADVDQAWARAAGLLRKTPEAFMAEVRQRMPLSLKAVDESQARRQAAALEQAGLNVAVLPEQGERLWLQHEGRICGPLSVTWLEHALDAGSIPAQAKVRRLAQGSAWIEVGDWRSGKDLDLELDSDALTSERVVTDHTQPSADGRDIEMGSVVPVATRMGISAALAPAASAGILPLYYARRDLYGGFWLRFVAAILDGLILYVASLFMIGFLSVAIEAPFTALTGWSPYASQYLGLRVLIFFMNICAAWLYAALFQSSRLQASPGMLALGLRVTTLAGERIGFGRATGRYFATILSGLILLFGYFMIGWTQRKQALHDMIAGTLVVRRAGLARYHDDIASGEAISGSSSNAGGLSAGAIVGIVFACLFVLVIPIMAAIAIPAYQDYVVRSQVAEGLSLADGVKTGVAEFYGNMDHYPADNASASLAAPESISGNYVTGVAVRDGNILIQYGNKANATIAGKTLMLAPQASGGSIKWSCQNANLPKQYLPASCR